jgi:hypothetical protein
MIYGSGADKNYKVSHKSFTGFKLTPPPARNFEKIKAVLPPSHLIGRTRIYNEKIYTGCLLLGLKADSTALAYLFSAFSLSANLAIP